MYNDNGNENHTWHMAVCLLEENLTRANRALKLKHIQKRLVIQMGRICVEPPNELEKRLRFKTIERFGGKNATYQKLSKNPYEHGLPNTRNTRTSHELRLAFQHKLHASNLSSPPPTRSFLRKRTVSRTRDSFSAFF
jgi:hypothetical protein